MSKTRIHCNNPYVDKTYESEKNVEEFERWLHNIENGNEGFIRFTDTLTGNLVTIAPENVAWLEFSTIEETE